MAEYDRLRRQREEIEQRPLKDLDQRASAEFDKWYRGKVLNVGVGDAFRAGYRLGFCAASPHTAQPTKGEDDAT